jgi:ribonuclease E
MSQDSTTQNVSLQDAQKQNQEGGVVLVQDQVSEFSSAQPSVSVPQLAPAPQPITEQQPIKTAQVQQPVLGLYYQLMPVPENPQYYQFVPVQNPTPQPMMMQQPIAPVQVQAPQQAPATQSTHVPSKAPAPTSFKDTDKPKVQKGELTPEEKLEIIKSLKR